MGLYPWGLYHWPLQSIQERILQALHADTAWVQHLMNGLSDLNGTLVYLCVIATVLWTVNKQVGRVLGTVLVLSEGIGDTLKYLVHSNRPYFDQAFLNGLLHPALDAGHYAGGYSLPSGHSFNLATFWGTFALYLCRKTWSIIGAIALILAVGLSRIALAAHWPLDVLSGWTFGALIVGGVWLIRRYRPDLPFTATTATLLAGLFVVIAAATYLVEPVGRSSSLSLIESGRAKNNPPPYFVCTTSASQEKTANPCAGASPVFISPDGAVRVPPEAAIHINADGSLDRERYSTGIPYAWRMIALGLGLLLGAFLEQKRVRFDPQVGDRKRQVLKLIIGLPMLVCTWLVLSPAVFAPAGKYPVFPLLQSGAAAFVVSFALPWLFTNLWPDCRRGS
ncbi:MAG: phosphatase PAP2 family protein [Mycobacterium leprae]